MAFQLKWSIEGEQQLSRRLRNIEQGTKDLQPAFQKTADYLVRIFSTDVFDTQGRAIEEQWQRLSPATVARKARTRMSPDILVATGAMKRSFVSSVSSVQAVISNTAEYFKYHQSNKARTSSLPRRVMMKLGKAQRVEIVRFFQDYLRDKAKRV